MGTSCPNCGTDNRPEARFCHACGNPLSLTCPNGHEVASGFRFCDTCGVPVSLEPDSATTASPPSALVRQEPATERRLVSVLFVDIVGFTSLSESRDAEEVRDFLTRYFDIAREIVSRYGGIIEKFIGDAVMAVWGAPIAQEDDAERSVRAALDLVHAIGVLGQELGASQLEARGGVLTGEAVVTLDAQNQGMVAGDLVNTASRIQSGTPPGAVHVGEATKRATEAAVIYQDAGIHSMKGKTQPMHLWRAVRVVSLRGGGLRPAGLEPPFVGRDREMRLVKEIFHGSSDEGKAHLASVVGIAGIGKSRLAWEFFKYVDGLADVVLLHRGRCLSYGEGVAYGALAEMVKMRAGLTEDEDGASARAKVRASVEEHITDPEERKWVEPRLAHLLGLEERVEPDRESLFSAWRIFFERMAESFPTILIFEDTQWADDALLDFIEYLLEWSRSHRLFLMTLSRPDLLDRRPEWGAGRRGFTSLYLEPLPPPAMEQLMAGLVPGLPPELLQRILDRAEGVPLYAVETVRMLIDRGLLIREADNYRQSKPVEALDVPETLHALIAARLDGLTHEERRLIQDGAVLGKVFAVPALHALSGGIDDELNSTLGSLVRKEVLSLQADPRSPERGHYGFLQDLVRRVAYESLSKRERREKHLAAASWLESSGPEEDELVEVVAAHYLDAYREAPDVPDAEEIRGKARHMLIRAGERAASLAAQIQAERHFRQAAELSDDAATEARLLERAGQAAYQGGRSADAKTLYESAMKLFESVDDGHSTARVSARLGDVDWEQGRLVEPVERMEEAFAVLSAEEPDEDLATLAAQLGRLHFFRGEMDVALPRIETALQIAETLALPEVISQALNTKALVLLYSGRREEPLALMKHALDVALENDMSAAALRAYVNLSEYLFRSDRYKDSLIKYEEGLVLARRVGNRVWEWALLSEMTFPLFAIGRWDEALERISQVPESEMNRADTLGPLLSLPAILVGRHDLPGAKRILSFFSRFESSEDVQERAAHALARAVIHRADGKLEDALRAAQEATGLARQIGPDSQMLKMGLDEGLEIAFELGNLDAAEEQLSIIGALGPGEITPFLRAVGARSRARLAMAKEQVQEAEAGFKSAAGMFREIAAPYWLAQALTHHGEWLLQRDQIEGAGSLIREAHEIFTELNARTWLDRTTVALSLCLAGAES
jgi:class 3 adenylate cyclase/tetratricopeptide (TPR) repeat protein